ncbi:MAG: outer membrane protein [Hyphomicrobiales bacterium]
MKHISLITLTLLLLVLNCNAQTEKGKFYLGANSDINAFYQDYSSKRYNSTTYGLNLNPEVGYFVSDNLVVGAKINLAYNKIKYSGNFSEEIDNSFYGIGLFTKHYLSTKALKPFVKAGIGYMYNNYTEVLPNKATTNQSSNTIYGDLDLGLAYYISKNISLDFSIGYRYNSFNSSKTISLDPSRKVHQLKTAVGFSISF